MTKQSVDCTSTHAQSNSRCLQSALSLPLPPLGREAELRQIRKATLLSTVNNLVFIGGPVLISMGGEAE